MRISKRISKNKSENTIFPGPFPQVSEFSIYVARIVDMQIATVLLRIVTTVLNEDVS